MIRSLVAVAVASLFLQGCGSGGSHSNNNNVPSAPVVRTTPVEYGYFGDFDGEIADTVDYVTYVFAMDWANWDVNEEFIKQRIIAQLQDAKARGIKKAVVAVGFLTWTTGYTLKGVDKLQAFKTELQSLELYDMIHALYPIDEPDVAISQGKLTEANLEAGLTNVKAVFTDKRLMVIYGDSGGFPAQSFYNIVGKDKYPGVPTVPLLPGQTAVLVVGGASPWKVDPNTTVDFALSHTEVEFIVNFIYGDYSDKGIKSNGMEPVFKAAGLRLKGTKLG